MKKILIIFLSIAFVPKIYGWEFKFIVGANISKHKLAIEHEAQGVGLNSGWKYRPGFLLGGQAEFILSENISIELDGLYFQKRSAHEHWDSVNQENQISIYVLHEISFPVLVKFKHLFNSSFYILGGGEFAYIIAGSENGRFDYGAVFGGGIEVKKVIPIISFDLIDYGAVFGGGIEVKKVIPIISFIEIRCHIGYKADTIALVLGL